MEYDAIALENEVPSPLFLESETTLDDFIGSWRRGKLPKQAWTHAAHLATAAYFAFDHAPEALFYAMKAGILHHNHCVGTPNTDNGGYHETLTRFWCAQVGELVRAGRFPSRLQAARAAVERFGADRNFPRGFYSFDVVTDRRARCEWVPPDCPGVSLSAFGPR
jgi:hypothetical protein